MGSSIIDSNNNITSKKNYTRNNGNGKKQGGGTGKEGGGSTDILFVDSVSEIEQILIEAGEEEEEEGIATGEMMNGDSDTPQHQHHQHHPSTHPSPGANDGGLSTNLRGKGGASRRANKGTGGDMTEADIPETDKGQELLSIGDHPTAAAPCADFAVSLVRPAATEALTGGRGLSLPVGYSVPKMPLAQRSRPWAIQKYLRPKGPLAWYEK